MKRFKQPSLPGLLIAGMPALANCLLTTHRHQLIHKIVNSLVRIFANHFHSPYDKAKWNSKLFEEIEIVQPRKLSKIVRAYFGKTAGYA